MRLNGKFTYYFIADCLHVNIIVLWPEYDIPIFWVAINLQKGLQRKRNTPEFICLVRYDFEVEVFRVPFVCEFILNVEIDFVFILQCDLGLIILFAFLFVRLVLVLGSYYLKRERGCIETAGVKYSQMVLLCNI